LVSVSAEKTLKSVLTTHPRLRFMLNVWLCARYKFSYYYYYTSQENNATPGSTVMIIPGHSLMDRFMSSVSWTSIPR